MPFVAAEPLIRSWLAGRFPAPVRVVTELPADLETVPVLQVTRIGGADSLPVLDVANVDVDTFGPSREAARDLAEEVRAALRFELPGSVIEGALVAEVTTISAPRWVPYGNPNVRRFVASYRITIRSTP